MTDPSDRPDGPIPVRLPLAHHWTPPHGMADAERRNRSAWFRWYLDELDRRYRDLDAGAPADYIPALARADRRAFGTAVRSVAGGLTAVGESEVLFTIQSISKIVLYGLALELHGRDAVLARVGVEPSGDPFNAISLDDVDNRPYNPMVNAGAIATADLVPGESLEDRMALVRSAFARYLGRDVEVDETVWRSELVSADRNRAIAYLMRSRGMVGDRVEETLELYTMQCSILVTAADLATIGATLANGGVQPVTGEVALEARYVRDVLAVMLTCGMYDYSGEWAYRVGLPAKSGVGGGVLAVLPGVGGLGVFSPPLDRHGSSVRGVKVCEDMSADLGVHLFEPSPAWGAAGD